MYTQNVASFHLVPKTSHAFTLHMYVYACVKSLSQDMRHEGSVQPGGKVKYVLFLMVFEVF